MKNLHVNWKFAILTFLYTVGLSAYLIAQDDTNMATSEMKAPDFELMDLDGNMVSLADYEGRFLVMHIATTWCPYCNAEAPYLEQLYKDYADHNVGVLIVDVKESKELVKEKLQDRFNFTFPVLLDSDGTMAGSYAPPDVLPDLARDEIMLASNILIDPSGSIQYMSLLDTRNFDAKLVHLKAKLDGMLRASN
ncbi:MAG: peroxiredoxin family protein [Saprospiraceae bacterium]|nr:peroxiredoxin family protein [Saprospiraceae bacterium]